MTNITILQQLTAGQKAVAWAEAAVGSLAAVLLPALQLGSVPVPSRGH
eukprot:CAMPEP_0203886440 /NCGR_PEP_ID=MMETSP0359-20131031/30258_1 /ASSEMBLY_ACC=CAM_ASM_000338 /TAXON_ID=268821 /ORGANISM="Scrippsiella Hangoei, Strain SHTV-5" /LENGTH=47 /DNA_ID= /DNA_START= /DNA_END= /DNA_ORIENTATION=